MDILRDYNQGFQYPVSETDPCSAGSVASNIYKKTLKRTQILETINIIGYQNIISPLFP